MPGFALSQADRGMLANSVGNTRIFKLHRGLRLRLEQLQMQLADQVQSLPFGNESWLDTERELVAVEQALSRIPDREA